MIKLSCIIIVDQEESEENNEEDVFTSRVTRNSSSQLRKIPAAANQKISAAPNQKTSTKSKLSSMVSGVLSKARRTFNIKGANSGANSGETSQSESTATSPVPSEKSSVYDFDSATAEESATFKKYKSPEKQSQLVNKPVKRLSKDAAVKPKMEPTEDADETPATRLSTKPKVRPSFFFVLKSVSLSFSLHLSLYDYFYF